MPLGGAVLGAAAPILGGIIGNIAGSGDRDKEAAARQAALQQMLGIHVPTIEEQKIALAQQSVAGTLDPSMQGTVTQGDSSMSGISTDPRLRQAQMSALSQMSDLGNTGLTTADRAALMKISNQTSGDAQANSASVMQNMAARGMSGGGAELAARLAGGQAAANRGAEAGQSLASQAQQKALQAMSNAGALGSQMEGQQFGEKGQIASAQDAISRFNAANRQNVAGQNVNSQNRTQEMNLQNKQNVANTNVGLMNQQEISNKGLYQQQFNNNLNKAKGASGEYANVANDAANQAAQTRAMYAGVGQGVGKGGAAIGDAIGKINAGSDGYSLPSNLKKSINKVASSDEEE